MVVAMEDAVAVNEVVVLALACASHWTGLSVEGVGEPLWAARAPTAAERRLTNRPADAIGFYMGEIEPGVIVAATWPALVHEACHHLQREHGLKYREAPCDEAQRRAFECL